MERENKKHRRLYGEHLTPQDVFREYILPEILPVLEKHVWVDMFAGEGSLILPMLDFVPKNDRERFFSKRVFLYDIQEGMVDKAIENAVEYGIPEGVAERNITVRDTLAEPPKLGDNVYHITNPPYLYVGYVKKQFRELMKYFVHPECQDLYHVALVNDLLNGLKQMVYIIPANFLFGHSVSDRMRMRVLENYRIRKSIIFEKGVFEHTGTNVGIFFFEKKPVTGHGEQSFTGIRVSENTASKRYRIQPENFYRAGGEFDNFLRRFSRHVLKVKYYLTIDEVLRNPGGNEVVLVNANRFHKWKGYEKHVFRINDLLYEKIKKNPLWLRTVDSGSVEKRAGLYYVNRFDADGIMAERRFRTHPIQVFIEPGPDAELLMSYFNLLLEYFREKTDSEFMTTYKYSYSRYTRKYLGLRQATSLIHTFPSEPSDEFVRAVKNGDAERIIEIMDESR